MTMKRISLIILSVAMLSVTLGLSAGDAEASTRVRVKAQSAHVVHSAKPAYKVQSRRPARPVGRVTWVDGQWIRTARGWEWRSGHWKKVRRTYTHSTVLIRL